MNLGLAYRRKKSKNQSDRDIEILLLVVQKCICVESDVKSKTRESDYELYLIFNFYLKLIVNRCKFSMCRFSNTFVLDT